LKKRKRRKPWGRVSEKKSGRRYSTPKERKKTKENIKSKINIPLTQKGGGDKSMLKGWGEEERYIQGSGT